MELLLGVLCVVAFLAFIAAASDVLPHDRAELAEREKERQKREGANYKPRTAWSDMREVATLTFAAIVAPLVLLLGLATIAAVLWLLFAGIAALPLSVAVLGGAALIALSLRKRRR